MKVKINLKKNGKHRSDDRNWNKSSHSNDVLPWNIK